MGIRIHKWAGLVVCGFVAVAAFLGSGCKMAMPKPSGFLSTYTNLVRYDDSTWRYVNAPRLATYDRFVISSVRMLVKSYDGDPVPEGTQQQASEVFRDIIEKKMAGHWQLLTKPSGHTAEIRAAITSMYPVGPSLMLGMEGEIVDAHSGKQLAAVMTFRAGPPQMENGISSFNFDNVMDGGWWNTESAKWIMEDWADEFVKALEKIDKSDAKPDQPQKR